MTEIYEIDPDFIARHNRRERKRLDQEFNALAGGLKARGVEIGSLVEAAQTFATAVPSWGMASGGTRFGTFPVAGQPRDVFEKIDDAAAVHSLTRANPTVSLHIPWDRVDDPAVLKRHGRARGLAFDAMNSNTFQDQPGQKHSYKHGSLSHSSKAVRDQAIAHNVECIEIGKKLGSKALSIWIADGSNYPGLLSFSESFALYQDSLEKIYRHLPADWDLFIEYKPYEPAFYYTVLADWGSALLAAAGTGDRCKVLVDLGHHLPNTNVEMIVARLIAAGKLGGFHFNDSQYGDDDLTAGSIDPYRLFRVFHELVTARRERGRKFRPAFLIDQSHNVKDPIEAVIQTTMELQNAWVAAHLVNPARLKAARKKQDVLAAEQELKNAFCADVRPVTAVARELRGGAIDPIAGYRESGYRAHKAKERRDR